MSKRAQKAVAKTTTGGKRKAHEASQASQPPPPFDNTKFLLEFHENRYKQPSRRGILAERKVGLKEGEYEEFMAELQWRKWHILAKLPDYINEGIVKEFYVNAIPEEVGQVGRRSFVRGKHISYNARTLNHLLKTKKSPNASPYEFNKWVNSEQLVDDKAVASLLCISGKA
ncbi:hypothetical protein E2542_SST05703 [Spatholobus suberectus]|nr:hypothetical protein E2542_SST05703 [Spatholobus suberectus]